MHPFIGMSQDEFLGSPVITSAANAAQLSPRELNSLADLHKEPFLAGRYRVKYGPSGAAVFDGSQVVASYNFGDTLVVNKRYRRQGIAAELVYQWRCRYPGPGTASTRTKAAQAIQLQVWERIAKEIQAEKPLRTYPFSKSCFVVDENVTIFAFESLQFLVAGIPWRILCLWCFVAADLTAL